MRSIFVGDLHGCLEETEMLLDKVRFRPLRDELVFVGDITDRGPFSVETLKLIRGLCEQGVAKCTRSNHDDKHVRFRHRQNQARDFGRQNTMKPFSPERMSEHERMSEDDIAWIKNLPTIIHTQGWVAVHAGFEDKPMNRQHPDTVIRVGWIDEVTGKSRQLEEDEHGNIIQPKGSVWWTSKWRGPESVVYGHTVFAEPLVEEVMPGIHCVGIDTGCVFGNKLTAMVLEDGLFTFVSVPALKTYATRGM